MSNPKFKKGDWVKSRHSGYIYEIIDPSDLDGDLYVEDVLYGIRVYFDKLDLIKIKKPLGKKATTSVGCHEIWQQGKYFCVKGVGLLDRRKRKKLLKMLSDSLEEGKR